MVLFWRRTFGHSKFFKIFQNHYFASTMHCQSNSEHHPPVQLFLQRDFVVKKTSELRDFPKKKPLKRKNFESDSRNRNYKFNKKKHLKMQMDDQPYQWFFLTLKNRNDKDDLPSRREDRQWQATSGGRSLRSSSCQ